MGFCHPGLAFSKLNGYSEPAGIWMFNNNAQLTVRFRLLFVVELINLP